MSKQNTASNLEDKRTIMYILEMEKQCKDDFSRNSRSLLQVTCTFHSKSHGITLFKHFPSMDLHDGFFLTSMIKIKTFLKV